MALQGDLQSFALPDVLRLLAGTSKTGRLGVAGAERSGDVWLRDGQIVAGSVSSSPHAHDPADIVFELLRFDGGSFAFEDDEQPAASADPTSVEDAIGQAEELVREWNEVEAVVPSVHNWVSFVAEIEGESTTITADHWRTLAVIGSGLTVRELGDHFEQTDLAASRLVKDLVEVGLVELGDAPIGASERAVPAPPPPVPAVEEVDDLSVLRADDGPVVIETSEDALLPEPLPSAGTSFEGDLADMTSVDGRRFDDGDPALAGFGGPEPEPAPYSAESFSPYTSEEATSASTDPAALYGDEPAVDPFEAFGPDPAAGIGQPDPEPAPAPGADLDPFGDEDPFGSDDFFSSGGSTEEVGDDPLDSTPSNAADVGGAGAAAEGEDSERGALLDFLSTVKP